MSKGGSEDQIILCPMPQSNQNLPLPLHGCFSPIAILFAFQTRNDVTLMSSCYCFLGNFAKNVSDISDKRDLAEMKLDGSYISKWNIENINYK